MKKQLKLWSSLSVATLVGAGVLSGCDNKPATEVTSDPVATEQVQPGLDDSAPAHAHEVAPVGGEGEGMSEDDDPVTDDVVFLSQLGQIRGHLLVGMELFRAGHLDHARTHMKHPEDELYSALKPAFEARGIPAFDSQLTGLAQSVEENKDASEVEAAYSALLAELDRVEGQVDASAQDWLLVAVELVRTAAEEYGIAVDDSGKMVNAHEYQDAFGFVKTADAMVAAIDGAGSEALSAAVAESKALIEPLYDAWPSLVPPETLDAATTSRLYGTAANMELEARGLE
ncbi:MAG: hypothetical protein WC997_11565 [Porticoccaceae bacterium]